MAWRDVAHADRPSAGEAPALLRLIAGRLVAALVLAATLVAPAAHAAGDTAVPAVWRVGMVPDWPPVDSVDARGVATGVSADVLARAARQLGVQVQTVTFENFDLALQAARAGRVDLLSALARTDERERDLKFTRAYVHLPVVYIGRNDVRDFSESADFGGRVVAVERGFVSHELLRQRFPKARLLEVASTADALRAVSQGQADVYRGALLPAHFIIERELLTNLAVLNTPRLAATDLRFGGTNPRIVAALDGVLQSLGGEELLSMGERWQPRYIALKPQRSSVLPSAAAVQGIGEIRVAYDVKFAPISRAEADGSAGGLAAEMFRRAADAAGLKYRFIAQPSFSAALAALRTGTADVVLAAVRNPERLTYASFVGPYYRTPSALVSRLDGGWPSLHALSGRTLAIDAEHYMIPVIQREMPGVRLRVVSSVDQVLLAVAEGRADAGLTNIEYAASLVATRFAGRLQVSGTVDGHASELSFMVRADRPDIATALNAGFEAVPEHDRQMLVNAQLRTKVATGLQWRDVAMTVVPIVAGLLGLLLATLLYAGRLRQARRQLREQRDLARAEAQTKAAFLADIGHDVRTPLAALATGLQLLEKETLPDKAQDMAALLRGSAERLVGLLNGLLDIAKLESGRLALMRRPTDLKLLLRDAVEQFRPLATTRGVDLRLDMPAQVPVLMLDAARTVQVVNNLLSNALKFTERGSVAVRLAVQPTRTQWKLTLVVTDTGVGMDEATRARLFERFVQGPDAQRLHGGHGLGMAIVSQILELAQGRVQVRSEPGRGTAVEVTVQAEEADDTTEAVDFDTPARVLFVDDDAVVQVVLGEQLRSRGYEVEAVADAAAALERLRSGGIDVLVADANLGAGVSGLDLAAQARTVTPDAALKVVILSGDACPQDVPGFVDGWVQKPVSPADGSWLQGLDRVLGRGST